MTLLDLIRGRNATRAPQGFATATPATPATHQEAEPPSVAKVATVAVARGRITNAEGHAKRLRNLARVAGLAEGFIERLHPDELAEYVHHTDAEAVASLQHLAECKACRERQTRRVTCATCARYIPNPGNPDAGMGQCADALCGAGPLPFPHVERHCTHWRAAS